MNRRIFSLCAFFLSCTTLMNTAFAEALNITDAWVREAPPTSTVNAAYMQITNPGTKDVVITGANSPQFETVEIHRTEIVDGIARMLPQAQLAVPAGGSVTLEPNGLHLMLIQPKQAVRAGDHVMIHLEIEGGMVMLHAVVQPATDKPMDHSQHMQH